MLKSQNSDFTEKMISKALLESSMYVSNVALSLKDRFFDSKEATILFNIIKEYYEKYKELPSKDIIYSFCKSEDIEDVNYYIKEIESIDFDLSKNYQFLLDETDTWMKESALKLAIMDSADIIHKGDSSEYGKIEELVKKALTTTIKFDLGLQYFNTMSERLKRMLTQTDIRIPTYFPILDEYLNGGFPPFTLSVGLGRIHGGKSNWMVNVASRQAMHGHNIAMFTLEMSEDAFAQRLDSIYSKLNINKIYLGKRKELLENLSKIKKIPGIGEIYIKQFPPGTASVNDFRIYLHELSMRNIKIDILYCDYVNLMKPAYINKGSLYEDVKKISEELRALSFEFKIPVVSVSQLNRGGSQVSFEEVDFIHTSECLDPFTKVVKKHLDIESEVYLKDIEIGDYIKGSHGYVRVNDVFPPKKKLKYKIKTKSGKEIICSGDHKFPTDKGLISINEGLIVGNKLNSL